MNWIDLVIIVLIIVSTLISLMRGFVKEALSLAGWIISFWIALTFAAGLGRLMDTTISDPILRLIFAFVLLLILSLLATSAVNFFANHLVERAGFAGTDRTIGVVFGVMRGVLVVTALVLFAGLTPFPHTSTWHDSFLLYYFEGFAVWLRDYMPSGVANSFKF